MKNKVPFTFNDILASTIHDMKNSLSMLMGSVNRMVMQVDVADNPHLEKENGIIQYEANRVNNGMMQLLALYKIEHGQLLFQPAYHNIYDFLEELLMAHQPILDAKNIICHIKADESLEAIFDDSLLTMALSNILGNAIRYAHGEIRLSVKVENGLCFQINDDGPGYPGPMLEFVADYASKIEQSTGSTGLGLYFAAQIARLHQHNGQQGTIQLQNGGVLGGGLFSLTIP